jgi:hypothetical protein
MTSQLIGTWLIRCPLGDIDKVKGITIQHTCSHGECGMKVKEEDCFWVVCPHEGCGQTDQVSGVIKEHKCSRCKREVRKDHNELLNAVSHITGLLPGPDYK